jgi:hypothetical protein
MGWHKSILSHGEGGIIKITFSLQRYSSCCCCCCCCQPSSTGPHRKSLLAPPPLPALQVPAP